MPDDQTKCDHTNETVRVVDGEAVIEHACPPCPHGFSKGYDLPQGAHPVQRVLTHRRLDELRCEDHHPDLIQPSPRVVWRRVDDPWETP